MIKVILAILITILICGCSSPTDEKSDQQIARDEEAHLMALYLSGALKAPPDTLYSVILYTLNEIRETNEAYIPDIESIEFHPPWIPSSLVVYFEPETYADIRAGEYHAWDWLNRYWQLKRIVYKDSWNQVFLSFRGQLNPNYILPDYKNLSGVRVAKKYSGGYRERGIYPGLRGDSTLTFLLYHGWGDCQVGCIFKEYWYFRCMIRDYYYYVGYFEHGDLEPDWWNEAEQNIESYLNDMYD